MKNEKGSILVQVLLVILIFSVLGLSVMSNVIGENKRVHKTESDLHMRNLARDGLTYFESDFKKYAAENNPINIKEFLREYEEGKVVPIGSEDEKEKIEIIAKLIVPEKIEATSEDSNKFVNLFKIKVSSRRFGESEENTLTGYYTMKFDIDIEEPTLKIADFTSGGKAVDVTQMDIIGLDLWILDLDLINIKGSDKKFYRIPNDHVVGLNLLGPILGFNIGDGDRFGLMEEERIVATRQGIILGLGLFHKFKDFSLLNLNVITLRDKDDTNVLIDGGFTAVSLLGFSFNGYRHIDFKKLAVIGNALIQQDRVGHVLTRDTEARRRFTFNEGLYVNRSLIIGGVQGNNGKPAEKWENYSKLMLRGDMAIMENLVIEDVDLQIGDTDERDYSLFEEERTSDLLVHGDAVIQNACVKRKNGQYDLRLFSKGKINLNNNTIASQCRDFDGLYYTNDEILIDTHNKDMTINGGVIGKMTVNGTGKVTINVDPKYLSKIKINHAELIPLGRDYE